jgi:outer membrane receptor protein involved in Fe transport
MFDTTIYDININQYNVNLGWVYSGFVNHTIKSGLQLDYTTADYNVYIVRFLHEFIMKGSTNQTDFWGPLNGDTAAAFNSSNDYFFFELTDRILVKYKGARKYYNAGFYLHDSWDIIPRLHLDIGARAEYSRSDHTTTFSPRFALNFNATKNNELILSAGHYTQNNYDISAIALSDDLKPEKVWHGSIGCESRLLPWLNQKIDFYGKYYYDLLSEIIVPVKDRENLNNPEPTSFPDGSNNDITEYLSPFYATYRSKYINDGKGYAFGTEYMLRFYPFDFWHGWISLSLGKSVRQRKEGWRKHPFPLDRPILISVHNYYRLPKQYEIGLKYRYMSGLPYTSVEEKDDQIEIGAFNNRRYAPYHRFDLRAFNNRRYAPYHRFDLRFSRGFSIKDAKGHFYIEIWNSMNAPNLFSLDNKSKEMITLSTNLPSTILFIGFDCSF